MLCQSCQPKQQHTCSRCGTDRPAQAIWPTGPVCRSCYGLAKRRPAPCPHCHHTRVLVSLDADHQPICGPCAGAELDYLCRRCHLGTHPPWFHGLCAGCVLPDTVTAIFGTNPQSPLRPIAEALLAHPEPARALQWLAGTATAKLLATLATATQPITHHTLDQLGGTNAAHLLRHMLVSATVLPERIEYLERIGPWLNDQLRHRPAAHARLIRPFVHWTLMPRSRRNAATIGFSEHAGTHLRARVLRALELLDWLDDQNITLRTATQPDLDRWLDTTPTYRRPHTRIFVNWALQHGHAHDIALPPKPEAPQRLEPLTDHDARQQLTRCLRDSAMPRDVRLAGALILLFGTTTARLIRLHTDAVVTGPDGQVKLHLGPTPLLLPPPLAAIAIEQAADPTRPRTPLARIARKPLLFPGRAPDQPIAARRLRNKLRRHGITPVPGRHAALVAMTGDIPAPILADLLGVTPATAVRWADAVNTDWTHYLAARSETSTNRNPPTSPRPTPPTQTANHHENSSR